LGRADVEPDVTAVVESAVARLASAGLDVELVDPPFDDPVEAFDTIWAGGLAGLLSTQLGGSTDGIDPGLRDLVERGRGVTLGEFLAAWRVVRAVAIALGEFLERFDVLLTPTVPIAAFAAGHDVPPGSGGRTWAEWTPFTFPFNMSQQPALSVPIGRTAEGLPVGLQVAGPRLRDDRVIAVGAALERALGPGTSLPGDDAVP
jgi:Asp-tRNA(Asn)/Glu-tRNA(Gln) amidotransferase A subunit family amidase